MSARRLMRQGELYCCLTRWDMDSGEYGYLVYREPGKKAVPRVYSRQFYDSRLAEPPVCEDLEGAARALRGEGVLSVLMPLSILVHIEGKRAAKRWHKLQRADGMDEAVKAYVDVYETSRL